MQGYQHFFQPTTVALPTGTTINQYGWIDVPSATDLVIPLVEMRATTEYNELYWFYESIISRSTNPLRINLEGSFQYDAATDSWPAATWKTITGFMVSADTPYHRNLMIPIRTVEGEALRIRILAETGPTNDFYFKFIGLGIPRQV